MSVLRFPHRLPRHAFSHRDAARAGDVWRAFQDVAVGGASLVGWPPERLRAAGSAFVVRSMTVVHHRETRFGEALDASTWVRRFRRDTLCTREVRLSAADGPVASGTQEWVHVDASGKPARAPRAMVESFEAHEEGGVEMPDVVPLDAPLRLPRCDFSFRPWHVWMDPLDHVNHPAYVDFCDEAIARALAEIGIDPADVVPIAETVTFRAPVVARDEVVVRTSLVGSTREGDAVLNHVIGTPSRDDAAHAITVRRLHPRAGEDLAKALAR